MEDKELKIENYGWIKFRMGSVDISAFNDEGEGIIYGASICLNVDDGSEDGHWIFMETAIQGNCKFCVSRDAANMVSFLADDVLASVTVFDEEGNELEELDLNSMEHEDEGDDIIDEFLDSETQKPTLH